MSCWLTDPELFLYAKGTGFDDVHLWRCKKPASSASSSSLVVPMKPDDFDYVSNVKNHLELIADLFDWAETDYKILVKYISERRLLVNSQGFVIAELYKVDRDGNKLTDGANGEAPLYIRSLDVLSLKTYISNLRERPIPLRTVKYLEDVNGKAALTEADVNARVDHLEAEIIRLKSMNNTLEGKVTKLTADLFTQMNLQDKLDPMKNNTGKEVWMNDITRSDWVGVERLGRKLAGHENIVFLGRPFTEDIIENGTNVRAAYLYKVKLNATDSDSRYYKAVAFEDLVPNKEKARFSQKWYYGTSQGKTYAIINRLEIE